MAEGCPAMHDSINGNGRRYRQAHCLPTIVLILFFFVVTSATAETFRAGAFEFEAPVGWQSEPPQSSMRQAQFRIVNPGDGPDGSCIFFYFGPGRGGSAEANIERWRQQFAEPDARQAAVVTVEEVAGQQVHYFQGSGTFLSGMPGGPKTPVPGITLLGAILESVKGNIYVRLVAPTSLAEAQQTAFKRMVESGLR